VNQRYLYLDTSGSLQGPLWLSQMRELYAVGRLGARTEVCVQGDNQWDEIGRFPEITGATAEMEQQFAMGATTQQATYERRLWRWLVLLLVLYAVYVVRSWK
jgi:hypothetical protein